MKFNLFCFVSILSLLFSLIFSLSFSFPVSESINHINYTTNEILSILPDITSNSENILNTTSTTLLSSLNANDKSLNIVNPLDYDYDIIPSMPLIIQVNHSFTGLLTNYTCYTDQPCVVYTLPLCKILYDPICYTDIQIFAMSGMKLTFSFYQFDPHKPSDYYLYYYQYGYYAINTNQGISYNNQYSWTWSLCAGYQASAFLRHLAFPNATYSFTIQASWLKTACYPRWYAYPYNGYCDSTCSQYLPQSFICQYHIPMSGSFQDIQAPSIHSCYNSLNYQKPNFTCHNGDINSLLPCVSSQSTSNHYVYRSNYVCYHHHCINACQNDELIYYRNGICSTNYTGYNVEITIDCDSSYHDYITDDDRTYYCVNYSFPYVLHVLYILFLLFGFFCSGCYFICIKDKKLTLDNEDEEDNDMYRKKHHAILPEERISKNDNKESSPSWMDNCCLNLLLSCYYVSLFCYSFHHKGHEKSFIRKPTLTTFVYNLGQRAASIYGTYQLIMNLYDVSFLHSFAWSNYYGSLFYLSCASGIIAIISLIPILLQFCLSYHQAMAMEVWKMLIHTMDELIMFGFYMQAYNLISPSNVLTIEAISAKYLANVSTICSSMMTLPNPLVILVNLLNASFLLFIMFPVVQRQPGELLDSQNQN